MAQLAAALLHVAGAAHGAPLLDDADPVDGPVDPLDGPVDPLDGPVDPVALLEIPPPPSASA